MTVLKLFIRFSSVRLTNYLFIINLSIKTPHYLDHLQTITILKIVQVIIQNYSPKKLVYHELSVEKPRPKQKGSE
jgi:hypothetical protein